MMTQREEEEFLKRIEKAKDKNIFVQKEIALNSHIRGVYCFYARKVNEEIPFYIGKSYNIFMRMFKGHIYNYLRGVRNTEVQKRMENYLDNNYFIEVRILKRVDYEGDSFIQDANRLALAELEEIVKQQSKGLCITKDQLSETIKPTEEKIWNALFKK